MLVARGADSVAAAGRGRCGPPLNIQHLDQPLRRIDVATLTLMWGLLAIFPFLHVYVEQVSTAPSMRLSTFYKGGSLVVHAPPPILHVARSALDGIDHPR